MKNQDHGWDYLVDKLMESGAIIALTHESGEQRLFYWIKQGYLKFRRKPPGMLIKVNDKEIEDIIKEFTPGGEGCWWPGKKFVFKGEVTENQDSPVANSDSTYLGFTIPGAKSEGGSLAY